MPLLNLFNPQLVFHLVFVQIVRVLPHQLLSHHNFFLHWLDIAIWLVGCFVDYWLDLHADTSSLSSYERGWLWFNWCFSQIDVQLILHIVQEHDVSDSWLAEPLLLLIFDLLRVQFFLFVLSVDFFYFIQHRILRTYMAASHWLPPRLAPLLFFGLVIVIWSWELAWNKF